MVGKPVGQGEGMLSGRWVMERLCGVRRVPAWEDFQAQRAGSYRLLARQKAAMETYGVEAGDKYGGVSARRITVWFDPL